MVVCSLRSFIITCKYKDQYCWGQRKTKKKSLKRDLESDMYGVSEIANIKTKRESKAGTEPSTNNNLTDNSLPQHDLEPLSVGTLVSGYTDTLVDLY